MYHEGTNKLFLHKRKNIIRYSQDIEFKENFKEESSKRELYQNQII